MRYTENEAREFLIKSGIFFDESDDTEEWEDEETRDKFKWNQTINMNDVWVWACAEGEVVKDSELPEVARLFWSYGWCGILYWVSEKHKGMTSEFYDNNRFIEFVRNEEDIRKKIPDYNKRAYHKAQYTINGDR